MTTRRIFQLIVVIAMLAASLASVGSARALSSCASYYIVQSGDTLNGIAMLCGTTAAAIQAANPGLGWQLYPGLVIYIPGGSPSAAPTPTYCSCSQYPPAYYPPGPQVPGLDYSQFRRLRVTYGHGLLVKTGPARSNPEIVSPFVSAVKFTTWLYRKGSVTMDKEGFVWVEVALPVVVNGHSTGWIVVKDGLGNYYTRPTIDPPKPDP
jgi:LysM domain-containing protein